jgi:hypothetical protein
MPLDFEQNQPLKEKNKQYITNPNKNETCDLNLIGNN